MSDIISIFRLGYETIMVAASQDAALLNKDAIPIYTGAAQYAIQAPFGPSFSISVRKNLTERGLQFPSQGNYEYNSSDGSVSFSVSQDLMTRKDGQPTMSYFPILDSKSWHYTKQWEKDVDDMSWPLIEKFLVDIVETIYS